MPACAALNCSSRQTRGCGKSFHRFPHNRPEVLKIWVMNMKRNTFKPSSKAVLCSDHFEERCFDRTGQTIRLRVDAVPTVFTFSGKFKKKERRQTEAHVVDNVIQFTLPPSPVPEETQNAAKKRVKIEHDYCIMDSPKSLKRRLDKALSTLHYVKRRLKISQQKLKRMKGRVQTLDPSEDPV
ncbi:THAP domain-containing protein 2-like [Gastrophryne carolinensis]